MNRHLENVVIGFRTMPLRHQAAVVLPPVLLFTSPWLLDVISADNSKDGGTEFLVIYNAIKHVTPVFGGIALCAGVMITYIRGRLYRRRFIGR